MHRRIGRPSPALVVAVIALFVALGGTGYAAATGSIDSREIKNNSVRGKDVRNSSLTGKDVKNSSLTGRDVKNSSLAGRDVKNGSLSGVDVFRDTLTGNEVKESTLSKVPSSGRADSAGSTDGVQVSRQVRAAEDTQATILSAGGFTLVLNCDNDNSGIGTGVYMRNDSAGDDSNLDSNDGGSDDFNQGDLEGLNTTSSTDNSYRGVYGAIGSKGSAISGQAYIVSAPSFAGAPACIGTATALGG